MSGGLPSGFGTRAATAAVLVPVVVALVLWLPPLAFAALIGLVTCLGAWEWTRLVGWRAPWARTGYVLATALALAGLERLLPAPGVTWVLSLAALAWWTAATLRVVRYEQGRAPAELTPEAKWGFGWLILLPAWAALAHLHRASESGPVLVLVLMVLVWCADIAAYLVGSRWGRRRLAPRVSPGKSLEGLAGALAFTLALAAVLAWLLPGVVGPLGFLLLCLATVVASVVGDLVESLFKRLAGVKDSGTLLPGHGGVLDRIDSLTAAAPVFVLGLMLGGGA